MRAPMQMNGKDGVISVTSPAIVKKPPMRTWRTIKRSPRCDDGRETR